MTDDPTDDLLREARLIDPHEKAVVLVIDLDTTYLLYRHPTNAMTRKQMAEVLRTIARQVELGEVQTMDQGWK